jgi:hypothetical protein
MFPSYKQATMKFALNFNLTFSTSAVLWKIANISGVEMSGRQIANCNFSSSEQIFAEGGARCD